MLRSGVSFIESEDTLDRTNIMIIPTLDLTYMSSYEVEIKFVENLSRNTVLGPRQSVTVITSEADELVIRYLSHIQRWPDASKL